MINPKIAILLFTRSTHIEASQKCFHSGISEKGNIEVARKLIHQTINTCIRSKIPYFVIDQKQQTGSYFGEKLSNAFRHIYNQGYTDVIAIGNDCPNLNVSDLNRATNLLINGTNVIGPAKDGGVYLIGLSRESFDNGVLSSIHWNSKSVLTELTGAIHKIEFLAPKFDIDKQISRRLKKQIGS